jgi:hypothetical protein
VQRNTETARGGDRAMERVQRDLQRTREAVAERILALRQEIVLRASWRAWVRHRPLACAGAAFVMGFLIASR